jgi:putative heme-binding domain-containing protein
VKPSVLGEARRLSEDPSPAVRREVALALRGLPFTESRAVLLKLAARYDGVDRWYLEALGTAASGIEAEVYSALLPALGHANSMLWNARFSGIAWRLHPTIAVDAFKARAASARLPAAARRQALVALGFINDPRAAQAMAELTLSELPDVATTANWWLNYRKTNDWRGYPVDGWVVDAPEVRPASIDAVLPLRALVLDGDAPIDRRIDAALTMAKDADGGHLLIQLAAENRLASPLREAAGSLIFSNPDRSVRAAAAGLFPRPGGPQRMTGGDVTAWVGDAARGQVRFAAACSTCHRVGSAGSDVGPELTDIHKKFDRAGLVDAIVNPNAAIAFGYAAELVVTHRSQPRIGFLQADGPTVSIRDGYGRAVSFAREDIATRVPLKSSLMLDPLALALSEQDVADIVAFLMTQVTK